MAAIKLGLTQRVELDPLRGERRDCLDQAWGELLAGLGFLAVPLANRDCDAGALIGELGLSGVILTGGNDLAQLPGARSAAPERDRFEAALLDACAERGLPALGVCRGLQVMVARAGGTLARVEGHVARPHPLVARPARGIPLADRPRVNSFHDFGVQPDALGPELEPVAFAPDGSVEAAVHRRRREWGIMWHPERAPRDPGDAALLRALFGSGGGAGAGP